MANKTRYRHHMAASKYHLGGSIGKWRKSVAISKMKEQSKCGQNISEKIIKSVSGKAACNQSKNIRRRREKRKSVAGEKKEKEKNNRRIKMKRNGNHQRSNGEE